MHLSTDQKGNIAEAAVALAAIKLGIDVYRPVGEGGRYDLILDAIERLIRVQCKWAARGRRSRGPLLLSSPHRTGNR